MYNKNFSIVIVAGLLALVLTVGSVLARTGSESDSARAASEAVSVFVAARG